MSVELPKPVAWRSAVSESDEENHLYWWVQSIVDCDEEQMTEPENLFTESQLLAYAAKCVEAERAKHAALVEAADGFVRAYETEHHFSSTGAMFHCIQTKKALPA